MRPRARHTSTIALIVLMTSALLIGTQVWAGPPTEALKKSVDEVVRTLEDPNLKKPEKRDERRKRLEDIISQRFDFEAMAKRTVG
jgi:phospholipid transport system substrate-binding protein